MQGRHATTLLMLSALGKSQDSLKQISQQTSQVTLNNPLLRDSFATTETTQIVLPKSTHEAVLKNKQHKIFPKQPVDMRLPLLTVTGALIFSYVNVATCCDQGSSRVRTKKKDSKFFSKHSAKSSIVQKSQDKRHLTRSR